MIVRYWVRPEGYGTTVPAIECADGFTMSVQASRSHYCTPRNDVGPYTAVEVGFPSKHENRIAPYARQQQRRVRLGAGGRAGRNHSRAWRAEGAMQMTINKKGTAL